MLEASLSRKVCTSMRHILEALQVYQHVSPRPATRENILLMTTHQKNFWLQWKISFPWCHLATLALDPAHEALMCLTTDRPALQTARKLTVSLLQSLFSLSELKVQFLLLPQLNCCRDKLHWKRSQWALTSLHPLNAALEIWMVQVDPHHHVNWLTLWVHDHYIQCSTESRNHFS